MRLPRSYSKNPIRPDNDGRTKIGDGVFFHGTSRRAARRILDQGLRDWTPEVEIRDYRRLRKLNENGRRLHGGVYGRGTYVTCDWRAAIFFGPVLFRVELKPGTRVLRLDEDPDTTVLDALRREFGQEILIKSPRKVMPRNKRLTLNEAIQLARYHHQRPYFSNNQIKIERHGALMFELRSLLVRYGIQGWGDPENLGGIVVFATDRLKVREVVLSLPNRPLYARAYSIHWNSADTATLEEFTQECQSATGAAARITHEWVKTANETLKTKQEAKP